MSLSTDRFDTFRQLHHQDDPLLLPNAWDYASAAALAAGGFQAIGTTSLGVAAASGKPDATGDTRDETLALARGISGLGLVTVDVEGGFSDRPEAVADLAAELAGMGIVGVNIEDGRPDRSLAPVDQQRELIAAVTQRVPELFVNARVDTYWLSGEQASLAETIGRAEAYTAAGAAGIFVPYATDDTTIATLVDALDLPLNVLFTPGRHTYRRLAELGVQRVSCGSLLFRAALHTAVRTASAIREGGPVEAAGIPSYAEVQALATSPR